MLDTREKVGESNKKEAGQTETRSGPSLTGPPTISLPKGGGAIRGMGEKFAANPVTGTGSMSVPLAISPGRSGFGPQLSLSYDSGAGNGPFGFGWGLSLPSITRKTDKGLPQYRDAEDSDVFILSGAEDLVPEFRKVAEPDEWAKDGDGNFLREEVLRDGYLVLRYRPRIEGLFARIERWTSETEPLDIFWRSISSDNVTTLYGKTKKSRIVDPSDQSKIFSWLICESYDDKGNAISYEYEGENSDEVDFSANEKNRSSRAQRYIKRIKYCNKSPRTPLENLSQRTDWLFEVVFDYGEHDPDDPKPNDNEQLDQNGKQKNKWRLCRHDPFSSYRAGFEVRTYRLCQRVLMFHHFPKEDIGSNCLVKSTDFVYRDTRGNATDLKQGHPIGSFIASVSQSGYKRKAAGGYLKKSLPPLEFTYSDAVINEDVQEIDPESIENLPYGLDGSHYRWVDLDGEGLSGILTDQSGAWFYKRNLSTLPVVGSNGKPNVAARFAPVERLPTMPSPASLSSGQQLLDLAGNGQLDVVEFDGPVPGFFERTTDEGWETFRSFASLPNIAWKDPNLKFVDLTGDGHADILVTEDEVLTWYPSLAEEGFGPAEKVRQTFDEETGPRLVFADGTQSIYLSDFSGDGLTDLVRIRNGEVCYWPNLGYGRFGAKVTMDNAPWFDTPDQFDQRRIRLADIDGSGVVDIIYLAADGVRLYFNQSGNRWSDARLLSNFPVIDSLSSVQVADLLGNGTACLVWSSPLPGNARRPMRYTNLTGGQKPHLLIKTVNNLGAETHVHYAPSSKFYLADKYAGRPWITKLPFPVHVVERVETYDHISRNLFVTRYAYHHGYFDGVEREFRGFGMVEHFDREEFAALNANSNFPDATNIDTASQVPPVHTKTWFHTGAFLENQRISKLFEREYYREPALRVSGPSDANKQAKDRVTAAQLLPDTLLPSDLTAQEEQEACRALKGTMLRQEVYALDGTPQAAHPYTVTEQNFTIQRLQAKGLNRHGVFFTHAREAISYHYERNPADPRIAHSLVLDVDPFGNVKKSVAIGYGRRPGQSPLTGDDMKKQEQLLITYTESDYTENDITNPADWVDANRTPLLCEARTYELTGFGLATGMARFALDDFAKNDFDALTSLNNIPYETPDPPSIKGKRLIECVRTRCRRNDLTALLPQGTLQSMAVPGESYRLAFTPGLLDVYESKIAPADLRTLLKSNDGRYVDLDADDHWWIPSGRVFFSPVIPNPQLAEPTTTEAALELAEAQQHFFLPRRYRDPFLNNSVVDYDVNDLLVTSTRDPLGNAVHAEINYRVLQPRRMTDPNGNNTEAAFDTLGLVVATAIIGKNGEGDKLEGFNSDLTQPELDAFFAAPRPPNRALLGKASTRILYDVDRFRRTQRAHFADPTQWLPTYAATLARETHVSDLLADTSTKIQVSLSYSDGFGREIQKKIQAEKGPLQPGGADVDARWVGSGWTIFNNKGKPVRQYEPFFDDTHDFKFGKQVGVSPILFYDPVERVVATLHPNHTYEKVVFDPWQQTTWDVNDTVASNGTETGDPRTDADIVGYVREYFKTQPATWRTWHAERIGRPVGDPERVAAEKAAAHAGTPTVAHFDALGRPFATIAHNKYERNGAIIEEKNATRVKLDIEGNQRAVRDAIEQNGDSQGRIVMLYDYDMLGNRIHQASMEAGERWMLNDVTGKPIRAWDSRGHTIETSYDELRRPVEMYVSGGDDIPVGERALAEKTVYGESEGSAKNHRGRAYQHYDGAGVVTNVEYDFKGNLIEASRTLVAEYKKQIDWNQPPAKEETFTATTQFDALNRPTVSTTPHNATIVPSEIRPIYNEANLLNEVRVKVRGGAETPYVKNIDYDAKGQRQLIEYGNGASTAYIYDPDTFRLTNLKTTRPVGLNGLASELFADPATVQDLRYTYDPVGNITYIEDAALQTVFNNNEKVEPVCEYNYDALYRLIEAHGREHIGQTAFDFNPPNGNYRDYPFAGLADFISHPNDMQQVRNYTERYEYDGVGNFKFMRHLASDGSWTRSYDYEEDSLIEAGKQSNRLTRTTVGNGFNHIEPYTHDAHGNMTGMPHLPLMQWDYRDQLRATAQQVINNGVPETTWYIYDASGQRVRKVTESAVSAQDTANGTMPKRKRERFYLGAFEIYRDYENDGVTIQLERETLHIMDDKQRIALVETRTLDRAGNDPAPPQTIRYQLANHLGSASVELTEDGALISCEEYHPYGTTAFQAGRSAAEVNLKRHRYTGKERDGESGFNFHGARYYAPWLGRWVSCDPIGLSDGVNVFAFVSNAPSNKMDLSGKAGQRPIGEQKQRGDLARDQWEKYFKSDPQYGRVIKESTYKDPTTKKTVALGPPGPSDSELLGRRQVDLAVERGNTGKGFVVEVATSRETFEGPRKKLQILKDQEAIARKLVVGNKKTGLIEPTEVFHAKGMFPILNQKGGNVPEAVPLVGADFSFSAQAPPTAPPASKPVAEKPLTQTAPVVVNAEKAAPTRIPQTESFRPASGGFLRNNADLIEMGAFAVAKALTNPAATGIILGVVDADASDPRNDQIAAVLGGLPPVADLVVALEVAIFYKTIAEPVFKEFYGQYPSPQSFFQIYSR